MDAPRRFESMLGWASGLIVAGLLVQLLTYLRVGAPSFVIFLAVGGTLTAAGALLFLCWLVTGGDRNGSL